MKIKQGDIAVLLGVSPGNMSLVIRGRKEISRKTSEKLAEVFPWTDYNYWRKKKAWKQIKKQYRVLLALQMKDAA